MRSQEARIILHVLKGKYNFNSLVMFNGSLLWSLRSLEESNIRQCVIFRFLHGNDMLRLLKQEFYCPCDGNKWFIPKNSLITDLGPYEDL